VQNAPSELNPAENANEKGGNPADEIEARPAEAAAIASELLSPLCDGENGPLITFCLGFLG
jgi:hypothetical protein